MKRTLTDVSTADFPETVRKWTDGAVLYDSSCSETARVFFLDRDEGCYLKTAPAGTLKTEAEMTAFFHKHGLSAEMLYYGTAGGKDYMITSRIPGEDCTFACYLSEPERLCDTVATLLRQLHETDPAGCPVQNRLEDYIASVRRGCEQRSYHPEYCTGIGEFASFEEAKKTACDGIKALKQEAVIHGDYCLPNILLDNWRFTGFIDVGAGGFCDRHLDIFWGIWSLNHNLNATKWTDRFLDVYGRDKADKEKLRLIAAMETVAC